MSRKGHKVHDPNQDRHHIRAKSRGGGNVENLVVLPVRWHACWHQLFVNMTVEEVHSFIDTVMVPDTEWTYKQLSQLRERLMQGRMAS